MSYSMYEQSNNITFQSLSPFKTVVFLQTIQSLFSAYCMHCFIFTMSAYSSHLFVYTVIVSIDSY